MAFSPLTPLLRLSRLLVLLAAISSIPVGFVFLAQSFEAATSGQPIELVLATRVPVGFTPINDIKAGFEDGWNYHYRPQPAGQTGLSPTVVRTIDFKLTADPQTLLLRYAEANSWKRLALYWLGASDRFNSLAWVLFFGVGSWLLWLLLLDVSSEMPFTMANARRLRGLALLVLGLYFEQKLAHLAIQALVPAFQVPGFAEPLSHYVQLSSENDLPGAITGIMLAIIALVYQRGVQLSREAELVI